MLLMILMVNKLLVHFMKKNCNCKKQFKIENVIKRKRKKQYVNYNLPLIYNYN